MIKKPQTIILNSQMPPIKRYLQERTQAIFSGPERCDQFKAGHLCGNEKANQTAGAHRFIFSVF
jgi:hypothetical protein